MTNRGLSRAVAHLAVLCRCASRWDPPRAAAQQRVGLDYAYYSPVSLVLKDKHWLEDELGPGVTVQWVLSAGSNKALEFLRGRSIDFGSTAGSAALLGRATARRSRRSTSIPCRNGPRW